MRLKHFLSVFLTLLTLSVGQMWGASPYTHTFATTTQSIEGNTCTVTVAAGEPLSIIVEKNGGSNFASYAPYRLYNKNKLTISANEGYEITSVVVTFNTYQALTVATDAPKYSYTTSSPCTFTPQDNSSKASSCSYVSFTNGKSSQAKITSVTITYQATPSGCTGTKLGTPVVTAEASSGQVRLTWPAVDNASSYQLKWNSGSWEAATSPVTKTGLSNGTAYTYQVKAIGNGSTYCDGDASEEASATPNLYHTVTWNTHNGEFTTTQVLDNTKPTFPKVNDKNPESCDDDADKFYGWSTTSFNKTGDISEKTIYTSASDMPKVTTDNVVYYAVFTDAEETDYSTIYSSNVTLPTSGTNVASARVNIGSTSDIPAVKLGKSGAGASCSISIPSGTTKLYLHAAGWNGKSSTLQLSTSVGTISPSTSTDLISNSGIANNSPFTLNTNQDGFDIDDYFYEYTLSSVTTAATITITVGTERGVIWGVNAISGSSLGDGNYLTNCCTPLGSINGSVSLTNDGCGAGELKATWKMKATTGIGSQVLHIYKASDNTEVTAKKVTGLSASTENQTQTISGLDNCTAYYVKVENISQGGSFCGDEMAGTSSSATTKGYTYGITKENVSLKAGETEAASTCDGGFMAEYVANTGYALQGTISVSGVSDFEWDGGVLYIEEENVTGNVTTTIAGICVEPFIDTQSTSASYQQGATPAALSVAATLSSGTLTYLWKVSTDNGDTWSNASGTNNAATYAAANISTANTGTTKYKCIVGNQEGGCEVESSVIAIEVTAPSKCLTPTFTVAADTYYEDQSVELGCNTAGVTIYYTTNNTTPTTSSSVYSSAITVTQTTTIKAIAVKAGLIDSDVAEATYTIKCETPTIVLAAGNYTGVQATTITKGYGTKIYYTTDGSTPDNTKTEYTEAVSIDQPMTLKAIVWKEGCTNSDVASAAYTLKCTTPTFNNGTGTYTGVQSITLSGTAGADIYYTLDGTDPSKTNGTKYTAAIEVSANQTVKAIAVKDGWGDSEIASATYTIQYNVYWWVNGADWNDKGGSTLVTYGQTATAPTTAPTKANGCGDKFMGWTETQNYENDNTAPMDMFTETSAAITKETNFYAVFADYGEEE